MGNLDSYIGQCFQHSKFHERQIQVLDVFMVKHVPVARIRYTSATRESNVGLTSTITLWYIDRWYDKISFDNTKSEWEV